jgi:hypothetical protein
VTPFNQIVDYLYSLMWRTTPITVFALVALMPWLDPPGIISFDWRFANTSAILISAIFGFLLQWSGALALGATSAITHVVLGQFKTCVILLAGYVLFQSNPGLKSLAGATMALTGMAVYTYLGLKKKEGKEEANPVSAKQPLLFPNEITSNNRFSPGDFHSNGNDTEHV